MSHGLWGIDHAAARVAMAWDEWAPHVQGGCEHGCHHDGDGAGSYGEFYIDHGAEGAGPRTDDLMPGLKGRSVLNFTHDVGRDGVPELYISGIHTDQNHRRDGVAEALLRKMHETHPDTRINPGFTTEDGDGLRSGLVDRIPEAGGVLALRRIAASLPEDFVEDLRRKFHEWAGTSGKSDAPLGHWPHIERFLKDTYPAAHRGYEFGMEEARPMVRNKPVTLAEDLPHIDEYHERTYDRPYETGPEAVAKHGYDPRMVAAGMVLLHNRVNNYDFDREDELAQDVDFLSDLHDTRQRMQRDYENRTHTAAAGQDPYDAQREALQHVVAMQHYFDEGEHPIRGGFDPGITVATSPVAHHPLVTNHWAAESRSDSPVSGPFGRRVQSAAGRYLETLVNVAQDGPGDPGGAGDKLDFARNGLRVELQHGGHFRVPHIKDLSTLARPRDALKLDVVNPRHAHGGEVPPIAQPTTPKELKAAKATIMAHLSAHGVNCQRCCLAADARHRGYNVEAERNYWNPIHDPHGSDKQFTDDELADMWRDKNNHPAEWIDAEDHFSLTAPGPAHWDQMTDHIASWGPGARGLIAMTQPDPDDPVNEDPFRHVIMAHVGKGSKVSYVDYQIGKSDASDWRNRILYGGHPLLYSSQQRQRVDGLTSDPLARKMVKNRMYSPLRFARIDHLGLSLRASQHLIDRGTAGPVPILPMDE